MDEGSTITLIDSELAKKIEVKGPSFPLKITGIGEVRNLDPCSQQVTFGISAIDSKMIHKIYKARTVQNFNLFSQSLRESDLTNYPHLSHLPFDYYEDVTPSILIGQDHWNLISSIQIRHSTPDEPAASLTQLGWVIHGKIRNSKPNIQQVYFTNGSDRARNCTTADVDLNELVKASFALESVGITNCKRKGKLEEKAEKILTTTAKKIGNRWEVGLLWKNNNIRLPDSKSYALHRLMTLEKKMDKDPEYAARYCKQVEHLINSGYAKKIKDDTSDSKSWYLPHFGVSKSGKPDSIRLVFDAAAKIKGISLNENLLSGIDLVNSLVGVLIRFRQGPIAFKGDIREMFLQIKICESDQNAQKFLWRGMNRTGDPDVYVMTSMLFGAASSPYTAQFIMRRNALQFETTHPEAVKAILEKHYVDDYIDSVDTVEKALKRITDVSSIHKRGGFEIRGWTSNSKSLLEKLPISSRSEEIVDLSIDQLPVEKTLGLQWNPSDDTMFFDLKMNKLPLEIYQGIRTPTKREMLRIIMSVYDPLGILLPFTIRSKVILQNVWRSGIGWDERLKDNEFLQWQQWTQALPQIKDHRITRAYFGNIRIPQNVELHLFSDASEKAYAAVAYLKITQDDGTIKVSFILGKARVAPLKPVSIPRLELQGALMASRLGQTIVEELDIKVKSRTFWTDSNTVLGWIRADPRRYQTFVAHRLGEITELTNIEEWKWIPGKQNPADCSTRDSGNVDRLMEKWIEGPKFLQLETSIWSQSVAKTIPPTIEEKKVFVVTNVEKKTYESPIIKNFSKWLVLIRSTALLLNVPRVWRNHRKSELCPELLENAEKHLIKKVQQEDFLEEIEDIERGNSVAKNSRIKSLTPSLSMEDGILRVDGRIKAAQHVPEATKCPIILDGKNYFTRLLIQHYHEKYHHGSTETVINELKQRFWILKIRPATRSVTAKCRFCRLRKAKAQQPRMGDLPPARLAHHCRPFTFCGLDYFGPMFVTIGRRKEKRWGALFTCLTTRAVHLEMVSSMSTDSAIMAVQRMCNRRGTPSEMYTDNGTNFTGMEAELKRNMMEINQTQFCDKMTNLGIKWRFIPPLAPHMGGSWERLVRSVKTSMAVVLKERCPKEEILRTLLTEIEHVINSRPLTAVSVDPKDKEALTPNHYLIGSSSGAVRYGEFTADDLCGRKQWRIAQRLADMFWARWVKEYLPSLIARKCWNTETRNLMEDDVVLIADSTLPRNMWPKGIINKVYPGKDGRVRIVDVRCRQKILKRAANKIIVLIPSSLDAG